MLSLECFSERPTEVLVSLHMFYYSILTYTLCLLRYIILICISICYWLNKLLSDLISSDKYATKHWCHPKCQISNKQFFLTRFSSDMSPFPRILDNLLTFPDSRQIPWHFQFFQTRGHTQTNSPHSGTSCWRWSHLLWYAALSLHTHMHTLHNSGVRKKSWVKKNKKIGFFT